MFFQWASLCKYSIKQITSWLACQFTFTNVALKWLLFLMNRYGFSLRWITSCLFKLRYWLQNSVCLFMTSLEYLLPVLNGCRAQTSMKIWFFFEMNNLMSFKLEYWLQNGFSHQFLPHLVTWQAQNVFKQDFYCSFWP